MALKDQIAVGAAWIWAFYPIAIYFSTTWIWETEWSTLLLAVLFWLTLSMGEQPGLRSWIWFGFLWGITALSNATGIISPGFGIMGGAPTRKAEQALAPGGVSSLASCFSPASHQGKYGITDCSSFLFRAR